MSSKKLIKKLFNFTGKIDLVGDIIYLIFNKNIDGR